VIRATDAAGNTADQSVTVTVTDADEIAPIIAGSTAPSVLENTTVVATYTANEPVTWSLNGGADAARFALTGGALSFTTAPDYEAPSDADSNNTYVVVIRATDIAGNRIDQTMVVTVVDANEAPALMDWSGVSVPENTGPGYIVGRLLGSDPDRGDPLQYRLVDGIRDNGFFEVQGDLVVTRGSLDFEAQRHHGLRVSVIDRGGLSVDRELTVTVTDVNDPPRLKEAIEDLTAVYRERFVWVFRRTAVMDQDNGQGMVFSLSGLPRGLTFNAQSVSISGTPEQVGDYPLKLTIRDAGTPPAEIEIPIQLHVQPADAKLKLSDLEQLYDGHPKPISVITEPADLNVVITYAGSSIAPTLPGLYPVVAFIRDPNISGLASAMMVISRPRYSLRLNPAYPMPLDEEVAKGRPLSPDLPLAQVLRPDGSVISPDELQAQRMTLRLIFDSLPTTPQGVACGRLKRLHGGVWSVVDPGTPLPFVVSASELEAGHLVYVPDRDKSGQPPAPWPFSAELVDALGVQLTRATGGQIDLSTPIPLAARVDLLDRSVEPIQRWRFAELLQNDLLPKGTTAMRVVETRTEQGGSVSIDGEWVTYRPAAELPPGVVDRFTYEIQNGSDTARASVLLAARSWTPEARSWDLHFLPEGRGIQLRFDTLPDRRFRVLAAESLVEPHSWNELGQGDSDQAGRFLWTGSVGLESHRFFRIEPTESR